MKKIYLAMLIALVGLAFTGCQQEKQQEGFYLGDLQGLWQEDGTKHYVRFTTESADMTGYFWGKQWDEDEKIYEDRLVYHGNGWFKYQLSEKGKLVEIHVMDNDGGLIPKTYIVTTLTNSRMVYYEEGYKNLKEYYNKVE